MLIAQATTRWNLEEPPQGTPLRSLQSLTQFLSDVLRSTSSIDYKKLNVIHNLKF